MGGYSIIQRLPIYLTFKWSHSTDEVFPLFRFSFIFHSTGKNLRLQAEPLERPSLSCYDGIWEGDSWNIAKVLTRYTTSNYHFVWVTKYRYHVLAGEVKLRVREIIRQICQQHDFLIEQGHVSKDHVHILVSAPTHMSASQIMQKIKGRSSRVLQQEFPHLKKRYWGQHIWARGYFCTTVGQVTDQMIRDYIEGHVGKSPDDSFTVDED